VERKGIAVAHPNLLCADHAVYLTQGLTRRLLRILSGKD